MSVYRTLFAAAAVLAGCAQPDANPPSQPSFDFARSKSRKIAGSETNESWLIDRSEAEWVGAHIEQLLADVQLSAYPKGGILIDSTGGFISQRGFCDGDVVKSINGMPIRDRWDLVNFSHNPQFKNARAMVVQLERAGRLFILDFRLDRDRR